MQVLKKHTRWGLLQWILLEITLETAEVLSQKTEQSALAPNQPSQLQ